MLFKTNKTKLQVRQAVNLGGGRQRRRKGKVMPFELSWNGGEPWGRQEHIWREGASERVKPRKATGKADICTCVLRLQLSASNCTGARDLGRKRALYQ